MAKDKLQLLSKRAYRYKAQAEQFHVCTMGVIAFLDEECELDRDFEIFYFQDDILIEMVEEPGFKIFLKKENKEKLSCLDARNGRKLYLNFYLSGTSIEVNMVEGELSVTETFSYYGTLIDTIQSIISDFYYGDYVEIHKSFEGFDVKR